MILLSNLESENKVFPTISIIIPTYNRTNFLKDALESVKNSYYQNLDVLVINDNGEDVENLVKQYGFNYQNLKENKKSPYIISEYTKKCKGDYVHVLCDDDIIYPHFYDSVIEEFDKYKDDNKVVAVDFAMSKIDENKKYIGFWGFPPVNEEDMLKFQVNKGNLFLFPSFVIKKNILLEIGGYDYNFGPVLDYELYCRLLSKGYKIKINNEVGVMYRMHEKQDTQLKLKSEELRKADMKVIEKYNKNFKIIKIRK